MAAPPVPKISNGDILKQSHGKTAATKGGKKAFKSNITNKTTSARSINSASAGVAESDEEDESDSSATEERTDEDDDADVFALSNGRQQPVGGAERRSAGPKSPDEAMIMDDATAGAEQSTDDDDDDQYADVEDIDDSDMSDDDGDLNESTVLRSVENDLIGEFERSEQRRDANGVTNAINDMALDDMVLDDDEARDIALAQQLSLQDANPHVDFDLAVNMDEDPFVGLTGDDTIYKAMWDEAEMAMWRRPGSPKERGNANGAQKRVRFEEVHDTFSRESSPASSEDGNDAFPDLFASQDDPTIQRHLALDVEDDNGMTPYAWDDLESCYDFDGDEENLAFQVDEEEDSDESDDDSDISDSDDGGDTTDEETEEEQMARLQERKAALAKAKATPATPTPNRAVSRAASTPSTPRPTTPRSGRGPIMGTFAKDPSRATITNDAVARRTRIEPPRNPPEKDKAFWERAKRAHLKPAGSRRGSGITVPNPGSDSMPDRPFTAQSTLGTMFNGNLDLLRNNDSGSSRPAFLPPTLSNTQLSFSATTATEDSEDDYADINMQDFIEMSDSDSDDDRPTSSHVDSPSESEMYSSSQTMGMPSASPGLLNHFELNRGLVGSFRRNQQHTKHLTSLASHPAKRASAHEYNALQKGRRGAANTPMTPARKKRVSQDLTQISGGVRKSISSPLTSRRPRSRGNSIATKNAAGLYDTLAKSPF